MNKQEKYALFIMIVGSIIILCGTRISLTWEKLELVLSMLSIWLAIFLAWFSYDTWKNHKDILSKMDEILSALKDKKE